MDNWPVHLSKDGVWATGGIGQSADDTFYARFWARDRDDALEQAMAFYADMKAKAE